MAQRKTEPKNEDREAQRRFVDQPGQWQNTTPASAKRRNDAAWSTLIKSLTPEQKKAYGIKK